ncbi:hypothetical protein AGMMS50262_11670 [Bacteroidia bacterium]|nr:hypothetical protein AGMMS50262_11670 [Bacteroidia bacterium]
MTVKRMIYRIFVRLLEKLMMFHSFKNCRSINLSIEKLDSSNEHCDIVTIAFNNIDTIERQIEMMKQNMQGDYTYIVADNSSDKTARKKIKKLCLNNSVAYISLPKNRLSIISGSYSHGASLNWIYYHVIKKRQPCYFGFVDHDLFPIKTISIKQKLEQQPIYGTLGQDTQYWYLWAGLCFYRYAFVKDLKMDFLPAKPQGVYLDTGGGNWYPIYSKMNRADLLFECQRIENMGEEENEINWFENTLHCIGDYWIHMVSASNWSEISPEKLEQKELMIKKKIAKKVFL